jgi:hypothetical protein
MITTAEEDFLTPAPIINETAFDKMCSILNLTEDERQLARFVICTYETAKDRHGGKH